MRSSLKATFPASPKAHIWFWEKGFVLVANPYPLKAISWSDGSQNLQPFQAAQIHLHEAHKHLNSVCFSSVSAKGSLGTTTSHHCLTSFGLRCSSTSYRPNELLLTGLPQCWDFRWFFVLLILPPLQANFVLSLRYRWWPQSHACFPVCFEPSIDPIIKAPCSCFRYLARRWPSLSRHLFYFSFNYTCKTARASPRIDCYGREEVDFSAVALVLSDIRSTTFYKFY